LNLKNNITVVYMHTRVTVNGFLKYVLKKRDIKLTETNPL